MADQPRAYSYIRFSTPEQAKGSSLARQLERTQKYALEHGLLLDDKLTFKDLGLSAYDASNLGPGSELGRFLDLVKAGRVPRGSYLLIESLDRLSRATISVALQLLLGLMTEGIVIVTLMDGYKYEQTNTSSDFTSLIISLTILQRANEESKTKGERVGTAWRKKREDAGIKKLTKMCPAWLRLSDDRSEYFMIPERIAVVRRIIDLTMQGVGRIKIVTMLNREGVKSIAPLRNPRRADGKRSNLDRSWHQSYVTKVLKSRALVGEFQPHRVEKATPTDKAKRVPAGLPVPGYFPALITEVEFAALQVAVTERGSKGGGRRGASFSNLFTGLLKCGYCEGSMVFVDKGIDKRGKRDNRRNKYVVCSRANRGLGCHKLPWVYYEFEDSFFSLATRTNFADFVATSNNRQGDVRQLRDQLASCEQALTRNKDHQKKLVDALLGDSPAPKAITDRLMELEVSAKTLTAEVSNLKNQLLIHEQQSTASHEALAAMQVVRTEVQERTGEEAYLFRARLNQHLRRMVDQISMYPGGLLCTEEERAAGRAKLLATGHPVSAVDLVVARMFRTKPLPADRCFMISNRGQELQVLHPDDEMPDMDERMTKIGQKANTTETKIA